jgi:hypothetical protein
MPKIPQWNTKVKRVLSATLITLDQIPAHMVARVSLWAFTRESGTTDQKVVAAEPTSRTAL